MPKPIYILVAIILFNFTNLNGQINTSNRFYKNYHPTRIFSLEVNSTIGLGKTQNNFMLFNTQYSFYQKPNYFFSLKSGIGMGYLKNSFGKLVAADIPINLIFATGKNAHFFETSFGTSFILGYSLANGFQAIPFIVQTFGYRYQIAGKVFLNPYLAMLFHPNLGFSPSIGIGVGYDY